MRSATLRLPELAGLIGKDVEIIVLEEPPGRGGRGRLQAFFDAAGKVAIDRRAVLDLRNASRL